LARDYRKLARDNPVITLVLRDCSLNVRASQSGEAAEGLKKEEMSLAIT